MKSNTKPRIFIGSSQESLPVAEALQQNLDHIAYVRIWYDNIFQLSASYLTSLINELDNFDFAIFIFTPDDKVVSRNNEYATVRDNVLYEMGLFTGRLGIEKVYYLKPRGVEVKIPSDLLGIRAGEYDDSNPDKNSSLRAFSTEIKQMIGKYFTYHFPEIGNWGVNILNEKVSVVEQNKNYSLTCRAPFGIHPRLAFKKLTADATYGFAVGQDKDVTLDKENDLQIARFLNNTGDKQIIFSGTGKIELTLYEVDINNPILKKEIHW